MSPVRKLTSEEPAQDYDPTVNKFGSFTAHLDQQESSENLSYSETSHENISNIPKEIANPPNVRKTAKPKVLQQGLNESQLTQVEEAIKNGNIDNIDAQILTIWILSKAPAMMKETDQTFNTMVNEAMENASKLNTIVNEGLVTLKKHKNSLTHEMEDDIIAIRKATAKAKVECENIHANYTSRLEEFEASLSASEESAISSIHSTSNASIDTIKTLHTTSFKIIEDIKNANKIGSKISKSVAANIQQLQDVNAKYM